MSHVVHSHVQQAIEQLQAELLGQISILRNHVNTLEGYYHDMFGSMSEEEMKNIVQIGNAIKAQIA